MKPELREQLGKAVYDAHRVKFARVGLPGRDWEAIGHDTQEMWREHAEAAVTTFVSLIMPNVTNLVETIIPMLTGEQKDRLITAVDIVRTAVEE